MLIEATKPLVLIGEVFAIVVVTVLFYKQDTQVSYRVCGVGTLVLLAATLGGAILTNETWLIWVSAIVLGFLLFVTILGGWKEGGTPRYDDWPWPEDFGYRRR